MSDMVGHCSYTHSMLLELDILFPVWTAWRAVSADWPQSVIAVHVASPRECGILLAIDPFPAVNFTWVLG
jgi:hypothetical protein